MSIKSLNAKVDYLQERIKRIENKNIVITGALLNFTRSRIKSEIEKEGGKVKNIISKNIDFLVVGSNPGSKLKNATTLNIKVLKEDEFIKLIKG